MALSHARTDPGKGIDPTGEHVIDRPEAVRVRSSGDSVRPIELAVNDGPDDGWHCLLFTRQQARHVVLALQAALVRTLPEPIIHPPDR